jgi:SAM-dependent methyltransferase
MLPKPKHLAAAYGAWFQDPGIIAAYHHRPPYPPEVFTVLAGLLPESPRVVLDVGCGTGDIARPLAPLVDRLDAVDVSAGMIAKGRRLPGGDHPRLHWIESRVEEASLRPPYGLITAGESLHWMAWEIVLPRFRAVLAPGGMVAIINRSWDGPAVRDRLRPLFARHSANRDYRPYDLVGELTQHGLFQEQGHRSIGPVPWQPTLDEYLEGRHSQNGFSRDRMADRGAAFDREMCETLDTLIREGVIELQDGRLGLAVEARIIWGRPCAAGPA